MNSPSPAEIAAFHRPPPPECNSTHTTADTRRAATTNSTIAATTKSVAPPQRNGRPGDEQSAAPGRRLLIALSWPAFAAGVGRSDGGKDGEDVLGGEGPAVVAFITEFMELAPEPLLVLGDSRPAIVVVADEQVEP